MEETAIFDQRYRVIAVDPEGLLLRGESSGDVLRITNADSETPLTEEDYPLGKLIALTDPSTEVPN